MCEWVLTLKRILFVSSNKDYGNHVKRMGLIAPLTPKERKILAELHTLKTYKKNTIIDKQGTVSKAVYYLNEGILAMEYKKIKSFH